MAQGQAWIRKTPVAKAFLGAHSHASAENRSVPARSGRGIHLSGGNRRVFQCEEDKIPWASL